MLKTFEQFINNNDIWYHVTPNDTLNFNIYSKDAIYNNVKQFLNRTFYSNIKYNDLLNSCDLSKGNCIDVSENLYSYFIKLGYKDIALIDLYEPKFNMSKAHSEYLHNNNIFHEVVRIGEYYVDLTGSQFSPEQSGINIYTKDELSNLWGIFKNPVDENNNHK